jgi:predicted 3-demethylubiquinone-9 3-methyltransferase (glyoxalase superfamily)
MTVPFSLGGREFLGLNGGPAYKFTPAISFFVDCNTEEEIRALFKTLSENGSVLMPLAKYPFSEKFAWVTDRFGVSWQLNLAHHPQKLTPFLMFNGKEFGKAEEAVRFYMSHFENSGIVKLVHANADGQQHVQQAIFTLHGQEFRAIDSPVQHNFGFTPATSFIVNCDTQQEIDRLWTALSAGGGEVQCGWLYDKYGVSWQVVPTALAEMMGKGDQARNNAMMGALLKMVKLDIAGLRDAWERG